MEYKPTYEELEIQLAELRKKAHILQLNFNIQAKENEKHTTELVKAKERSKESEKQFQLLYNNAILNYQSLDRNACLIDVNPLWLKTLGYKREEVLGRPFSDFMTSASAQLIKERFLDFTKNGEIHNELEMVRKDGTSITVSYEGKIGNDAFGNFHHTHCVFADITERKVLEHELLEANQFNQQIINSAAEGIIVYDRDLKFQVWNPFMEELSGMPAADVLGKHPLDLFPFLESEGVISNIEKGLKGIKDKKAKEFPFSMPITGKKGWVSDSTAPLYDHKGEIIGVITTVRDITERKQFEIELLKEKGKAEESEERFKLISNNLVNSLIYQVIVIDKNNRKFTFLSDTVQQLYGCTANEAMENSDLIYGKIYKDDINSFIKKEKEAIKTMSIFKSEVRVVNSDGSIRWSYFVSKPRIIAGLVHWDGIELDITEQKKMLNDLEEIKNKALEGQKSYKALFETIGDAIYIQDYEAKFLDVNNGALNMYGYSKEEFIGNTPMFLSAPNKNNMSAVFECFDKVKQGIPQVFDFWGERKNGEIFPKVVGQYKGTYFGQDVIITVARDITESKQAEDALKESENNYRKLVEIMPDGVYKSTHEGEFVAANPAMIKMLGYNSKEELFAVDIKNDLYIKDSDRNNVTLNELSQELAIFQLRKKDKSLIWVEDHGWYSFNELGEISYHEGIIRDVTERIHKEQELIKAKESVEVSEQKFRNIIENALIGVFETDIEGNILFGNKYLIEKSGYKNLNEIKSKNISSNYFNPKQRNIIVDRLQKEGVISHLEIDLLDVNNQIIHCIMSMRLNNNRILGMLLDITDKKKYEKELFQQNEELLIAKKEAKKNLEMILSSQSLAHICSYSTNINEKDLEKSAWVCSPEFYKIFGIDKMYPHTIAGWAGFIHPDYLEELVAYHEYVVKNRVSFNREYKIIRINDGVERWVLGSGELVYDEQGKPVRMLGAIQDITDRKIAEQALKDSDERWKLLFKDIPNVAVQGYDKNGITKYWNKASERLYGYSSEEAIGIHLTDLIIPEELKSPINNAIKAMYTTKIPIPADEIKLKRKDGSAIIVFSSHSFVEVSGHEPEMYCIDIDISGRKQAELELVKAKEKAEESDKLKSAFLANMSHEIRTPMNGILGFADLLKTPNLSGEKQQEYIKVIEKSGERMLNIINDIVSISKIESGLMNVFLEETNFNEQVAFVYTFFKPEVENKGIQFSLENVMPIRESIIYTDREKVYAIITNLVKNAIKYTEKGAIELGYYKKDDFLQFYVKDTGIGIPKNQQEAVFERFIQSEASNRMAKQGAGLGLSITKAYVTMLGGQLWLESEEENLLTGKPGGSTFYFTLPYQTAVNIEESVPIKVSPPPEESSTKKLKILIAEDDESSEILLTIAIEEFAREIIIVKNGFEAVEACRANPDIDLVFMDIQMPEMNGFEATKQIRKFNTQVTIIAQTAYALEGDKEKVMAAGCNDYITKPIKVDELKQLISLHLTC